MVLIFVLSRGLGGENFALCLLLRILKTARRMCIVDGVNAWINSVLVGQHTDQTVHVAGGYRRWLDHLSALVALKPPGIVIQHAIVTLPGYCRCWPQPSVSPNVQTMPPSGRILPTAKLHLAEPGKIRKVYRTRSNSLVPGHHSLTYDRTQYLTNPRCMAFAVFQHGNVPESRTIHATTMRCTRNIHALLLSPFRDRN